MVLKRAWLGVFLLVMGTEAGAAMTGVTGTHVVRRSACPVKTRWRWRDTWMNYDGVIAAGTEVRGVRPLENADILVFQMPGSDDFFAASWRCMFAENDAAVEVDRKTYSGWMLSLGLVSWEETFAYKNLLTEESHTLRARATGVCPGDGYLLRRHDWDVGFTGCLAFARADVRPWGDAKHDAGFSYSQSNVNVFSLFAGPEALWRPGSGNLAFGVHVPLMARFALWREPTDTSVGDKLRFAMGALLESRVEIGAWSIAQRFGWLGLSSDYLWYFGVNRDFR